MTISHLFDHTCVIWRKVETLGTARTTTKAFTLLPGGPFGLKANRKNALVTNAGPGIVDAGLRVLYFEVGPVILKRDLVELITGPDAPPSSGERAILEVENVTIPRGHHIEVRCSEYHGAEPELGS
jgi:hypothetical protein